MKIKTKLYLSILVSATLIVLFLLTRIILFDSIGQESKRVKLAAEVKTAVFDLNILLNDYLFNRTERAAKQWELRYNSGLTVLQKAEVEKSERALIKTLANDYLLFSRSFKQAVENYNYKQKLIKDGVSPQELALLENQDARTILQLSIQSQSVISSANILEQRALVRLDDMYALTRNSAYILAILILIITTAVSIKISRDISKSLTKLHKGSEIIGAGNLEYKIDITSKDEIGQMARSFNEMAEKLKKFVATKIKTTQLEKELAQQREIDRAKSEFVSLASHQLRTPLTTINWYSEMLLSGDAGKITEKQKEYLKEVYLGSQRMNDLVNALLNVSRIEMGTFLVESVPTDVIEIADSVLDELKVTIDEKNLKVSESHDQFPKIPVDPKIIRIVYQNILDNAVRYTPGGGKITLKHTLVKKGTTLNKHPVSRDCVLITVADTGYGIPKNQQAHVFEKLFRADNVREKDTKGTGLGLYIVKAIIDYSGGEIWFKSVENKGTTFFVTLPLVGMPRREGSKMLDG